MTNQNDSESYTKGNDLSKNFQGQLAEKMTKLFELVISDRSKHFAQNPDAIPDKKSVSSIINSYSVSNASISGASSLVPGPLGMLAVIPELTVVIRNQLAMIYDIGRAYGKESVLTKELLAGIFLTAIGGGAGALLFMHGGKVLVKRVTLRVFQQIIVLLAGRVTQQALKSAISKWLPGIGAAAMAVWSGYLTRQIGKKAEEIFGKEIEISEDNVEDLTVVDVAAQTVQNLIPEQLDSKNIANPNMPKIQTLINLMRIDGTIQPEEKEYIKTILRNAGLTTDNIAEIREVLSTGKRFNVDYSAILNSPDEAVGLLVDLVALAKRDGTFHIAEKIYIKQVGKLLGFSDSDVEETMATVSRCNMDLYQLRSITQQSLLTITAMTLRELQDQALRLPVEERWQLINALQQSLQPTSQPTVKQKGLAASLIGIAKTAEASPTDEEVNAMLDERLAQKYL